MLPGVLSIPSWLVYYETDTNRVKLTSQYQEYIVDVSTSSRMEIHRLIPVQVASSFWCFAMESVFQHGWRQLALQNDGRGLIRVLVVQLTVTNNPPPPPIHPHPLPLLHLVWIFISTFLSIVKKNLSIISNIQLCREQHLGNQDYSTEPSISFRNYMQNLQSLK